MSQAKTTTDRETIRQWTEERGGHPATVKDTSSDGAGLLRIDFPGTEDPQLEPIEWEEFFGKFEEKNLAFLYQEETEEGNTSRFCKFIERTS